MRYTIGELIAGFFLSSFSTLPLLLEINMLFLGLRNSLPIWVANDHPLLGGIYGEAKQLTV